MSIKAAATYYEWIRRRMRQGRPLSEFVADMVTASVAEVLSMPMSKTRRRLRR